MICEFRRLEDEKKAALAEFYDVLRQKCDEVLGGYAPPVDLHATCRMMEFFLPVIEGGGEIYCDILSGDSPVPLGMAFLAREFHDVPDTHFYLVDDNELRGLDIAEAQARYFGIEKSITPVRARAEKPEWLALMPYNLAGLTAFGTRYDPMDAEFWYKLGKPGNISFEDLVAIAPKIIIADYHLECPDAPVENFDPYYRRKATAPTEFKGLNRHGIIYSDRVRIPSSTFRS